jgi:PKD repeat protein
MEPSRTVLILITLVLASLSVAATNDPFTITPTEGIAPLTISYACTANTGIAPYSYAIGFGDGSQTSDRTGSYTYHTAGTYTVTCTARDAIGRPSTYTKQVTVHPNTPITASLTVSPTKGYAPLTSAYSCSATGGIAPYSYALAFGDGSQTSDRSGSYTFHAAGTYEVSCVARDAIGRSGTAKKTVTVDPVTPVKVTLSVSPTSGRAPLTSAYSCSATGGIAPYSYALSFGDGSQTSDRSGSYTFHTPGTYTVSCTARDAIGQKGSASKTVTVDDPLAPLSVTYAVTPSNGQAPLTTAHLCSASGGLAPYSYTITTGDGRSITAASATHVYARGSYTAKCTVTDAFGSSASRSRSVSVSAANTVPSASLSVTPTSGYAPLTVNYSCTVSGGDAPLSSIVRFGSSTTSALSGEIEFSDPGSYTVSCETTDADGDRADDSVTVTVQKAPSFSVSLSVDPSSGYAPLTSSYSCSATGGIAPYSYALSFGDGSQTSDRSGSYTFHAAGTYEVSCVARDAIGQQATAKRTVTVDPVTPVKVALSVSPTSGYAPLTSSYSCSATGGIAPYSYALSFGDGSQTSDRSGSYTFHAPGTYAVSCTARDAIGQKGSASKTVTVDEPVPPKDPLSVSLTASPDSGYAPLIVSYSCDVSGGRAPIDTIVRFGPSTTSALSGEIGFATPGSYGISCEALDADGDSASDAVTITVLEAPKLSASLSIEPSSGPAPLAVSYACSASGGIAPYSYVIAFGDGSSNLARTGPYTYLWPGTYTATCTAHDAIGQKATAKRTVTVDEPIPDLAVSYAVTPQHGPAPLTTEHVCSASGGVPPYAYVIDTADGPTVPAAAATYTYDAPGSYEASCTVTDARGSTRIAKKWVTAIEPIDPFEAALTAEPTSGYAPLTVGYSCSTSGGSFPHAVSVSVADLMTSAASGEIVFEYPGVFELRCDATDAKGAHASDAVTITVEEPAPGPYAIELSATPDRGLEPLDTRIRCDALGGHGALSYVIDFGVGPVLESAAPIDETVRYATYGVYDVTCTATDSLDRSISDTVPVIVLPESTVSIAPQDPMSDDDLVCRVDAYPEGSFDFTWYRNGELIASSLSVSSSTITQDRPRPVTCSRASRSCLTSAMRSAETRSRSARTRCLTR